MDYRREIDGLRALAIIPVILYHSGFSFFSGGYIGVDIFFVISGYLICKILVSDLQLGVFSLAKFYERRAKRILPALFLVLLITIPLSWFLLTPYELIRYSRSIAAVSFFYANIFFWKDGGYFETAADLKPLLHTWSLSVEEQFYILFPLLLFLINKYCRKYLLWLIFAIFCVSLFIAQLESSKNPVANFFLLPSRAWELCLGAISALLFVDNYFRDLSYRYKQIFSILGSLMIVVPIFAYDKNTPFPSLFTLVPTIGSFLIIMFSDSKCYIGKLLGSKYFVGFGLISYSAYLWHQPILAYARIFFHSNTQIPIFSILVLILIVSYASWRFIETPLRRTNKISTNYVLILSGLLASIFAMFGIFSSDSLSHTNIEERMALKLSSAVAIYVTNMDEISFVRSRIKVESITPPVVVIGSSRVMQIGSNLLGKEVLNLAVSGASVEDDVAIWKLLSSRYVPELVLIGVDPWLFNSSSGQTRWKTLEEDYNAGLDKISAIHKYTQNYKPTDINKTETFFSMLYSNINYDNITAENELPENLDKIRRDGSRVYNTEYANKSSDIVKKDAISYVNYSMTPYAYSASAERIFSNLISNIKLNSKLILVLVPYHPSLYKYMAEHDKKFLQIESEFRSLAAAYNLTVIGSYDPFLIGCGIEEFYDGMHPKDSCIQKIISPLR